MPTKQRMIGIRVTEEQHRRLKAQAAKRKLTLTELLVGAGLGELDDVSLARKVTDLEQRVTLLEAQS